MNFEKYLEEYDGSYVHFSSQPPRHRTATIPDRARAKRRAFKKRATPNPVRGIAHRRNKPISW